MSTQRASELNSQSHHQPWHTRLKAYQPRVPRHATSTPGRPSCLEIYRDGSGRIIHLRIGKWRILAATEQRRIAEVRELVCDRIAVRVEVVDPARFAPSCTIWELYDTTGHLLTMLQYLHEDQVWLATDFQAGKVSRSFQRMDALPSDTSSTSDRGSSAI